VGVGEVDCWSGGCVRKATGDDALRGDAGESLVEGETGSVATNSSVAHMLGLLQTYFGKCWISWVTGTSL
jgi:hypothetical protein